uniref:Uncharacterized protein n=1 Tax=Oryza glumipatula TaxID=40148 RepID=A0A0E0A0X0_9ORYZ
MQFHQGRHHRHPNVGVVLCSVFFWEKPTQHTIIGVGEGGQRPAMTRSALFLYYPTEEVEVGDKAMPLLLEAEASGSPFPFPSRCKTTSVASTAGGAVSAAFPVATDRVMRRCYSTGFIEGREEREGRIRNADKWRIGIEMTNEYGLLNLNIGGEEG